MGVFEFLLILSLAFIITYLPSKFMDTIQQEKTSVNRCCNCSFADDRYKEILEPQDLTWCCRCGFAKNVLGYCDEWKSKE